MRLSPLALSALLCLASPAATAGPPAGDPAFGKLPLLFEKNGGHYDPDVEFLTRAPGYRLFLTSDAATMSLQEVSDGQPRFATAVRTRFVDAHENPEIEGLDQAQTRIHYLIGNRPEAWSVDNRTFHRVRYRDLWDGIDLVLYDQQGQLEYDFVLAPGADPSRIRMRYEGIERLDVLSTGELRLLTTVGELLHSAPVIHQPTEDGLAEVSGRFVELSRDEVGFVVDAYDPQRQLVIDPVLVYSTLLGGGGNDFLHDVAVGASGSAVVTGQTISADLPVTVGALDQLYNDQEAFVARFSPDGTALEWCTYLGGSTPIPFARDYGQAVELDAAEQAHVAGWTSSDNFPVTANAIKLANGSDWFAEDGFLSILSADGSSLVYSTLIGGDFQDRIFGLDVDPAGVVSVCGEAGPNLYTTANAAQPGHSAQYDAFVYRFAPGGAIQYATYLGSTAFDHAYDVEYGADGRLYLGGRTDSAGFPTTAGAFQVAKAASHDAFVSRLNPVTGALEYSSFLGGDSGDMAFERLGIATDGTGLVWMAGGSKSTDFPTSPGALRTTDINPGFTTGTLTCLDTNQSGAASLVFSTLFGGTAVDSLTDVALDSLGNSWVLGWSHSNNHPLVGAWDEERESVDLTLSCFDPAGNLLNATLFGGRGPEPHSGVGFIGDLAIDPDDNLFVASTVVTLADRLTTPGAFQSGLTGGADCVVARFTPTTPACHADIGYQGHGDLTLSLCGDPGFAAGTFSRLEINGALPGSLIYLFASSQATPTYVPKIDASLVPIPLESLFILSQGGLQDIELFVPGMPGPFTFYLQALAPNQGGNDPWHTSNAIQVDVQ